MYNYTFDLNGLKSDLSHKVYTNEKDFVEFNVCGDISKTCDSKSHVAACLNKDGKQHIIGIVFIFVLKFFLNRNSLFCRARC